LPICEASKQIERRYGAQYGTKAPHVP